MIKVAAPTMAFEGAGLGHPGARRRRRIDDFELAAVYGGCGTSGSRTAPMKCIANKSASWNLSRYRPKA